ncbi:hypothetical protein HanXRQr2_Chr16g0726621 [Helianthus annuus]|uniref:Uncharacterized protein n=1 Tax=Helianthus annuus TaxID=4232 RepID=A0A9K3DMT5_HELAN|nr:hypothetical protein HanXRQr2_Chr16g0726621 [Helianthus annuus]KAJ0905032.1 hypothetical protein HanPSC8_Chr07g0289301 [Helianthus annuus]
MYLHPQLRLVSASSILHLPLIRLKIESLHQGSTLIDVAAVCCHCW